MFNQCQVYREKWLMYRCSVLVLTIFSLNALADTLWYGPYTHKGDTVKIYTYNPLNSSDRMLTIYKFGDLIYRAKEYKEDHPGTAVKVKLVLYKLHRLVYIGHTTGQTSYGNVKNVDHDGSNTAKLTSIIDWAAQAGVEIDVIYHKSGSGSDDVGSELASIASNNSNMSVKQVTWGSSSAQQMHAKFITVSHYNGDGSAEFFDTVYTATSNVDDFSGWNPQPDMVQSGVMISGNSDLYDRHVIYADTIATNYTSQSNFKIAMNTLHGQSGGFNLTDDSGIKAYFYPILANICGSGTDDNAWDAGSTANGPLYNPVSAYSLSSTFFPFSSSGYVKMNMYHFKNDAFGAKLTANFNAHNSNGASVKAVYHKDSGRGGIYNSDNENGWNVHEAGGTHAKNIQFAGNGNYVTITGSTNTKRDAYCDKANTHLVFEEYGSTNRPIYLAYRDIYDMAKDNNQSSFTR